MKSWLISLTIISIVFFNVFSEVSNKIEEINNVKSDRVSYMLGE